MTNLDSLVSYLNDYLALRDVPDYPQALNGLQVQGKPVIRRVAVCVDVCVATLEQAIAQRADLMIVHHGLFWGANAPVTGTYYRRLALLIKNDLGLYSCHTPLDAHPEVGNNHVLARLLGLNVTGVWGEMEGVPIGVYAETDTPREEFAARVTSVLADVSTRTPHVIATGPERVRRVGIITGAAGTWIEKAHNAGIDTFLTGEGPHHTYFDAEELGLNVLYAGHYATETVGVRALGQHLQERFGLETCFIDHPTGL